MTHNRLVSASGRSLLRAVACGAVLAAGPAQAAGDGTPSWGRLIESTSSRQQVEWAQRYEHGEGVPTSLYRAAALYCSAADKGDAQAAYQLGWMYANGRGLPRDDALAAAWFRKAAGSGDAYAKRMLGHLGKVPRVEPACRLPTSGGGGVARLASLSSVSPEERRAVEEAVHAMAPGFGLDPRLVLAVISAESAFDRTAVSPKGAQGLMQLMPETASRFGVADAFDPQQNLRGGMTYLAWLLEQFAGDLHHALAAYNAGEKAVEQFRGIPPYAETRDYVRRVLGYYDGYQAVASKDKRG